MAHSAEKHPLVQPPVETGRWGVGLVLGGLLLACANQVGAQMVPRAEHAWRQGSAYSNFTTARIAINHSADEADGEEVRGHGLNLRGQSFWPHWEGRIGAVIDRPVNPLKDSFLLAQPAPSGLRLRSAHVLSDYYLEGGFRATAGLLRGETGHAWWSSGDNGGGLNLSLQRLDTLGMMGSPNSPSADGNGQQTMGYLGAGYSTRLGFNGAPSAWRFNADFGLVSVNASNINRLSQVFQGDKSLDELVHELRLRPVVKVSVGYSF